MKKQITQRLCAFLSSRGFSYGILAFFVFESVWIALSARYPMAFDEDFHFGIIKLYAANHWSPFFTGQPPNADAFGPVARDPSYLYHYLMSFPYRLVAALTHSQMAQVIVLRLVNVAFVAGGLVATRALLLRAKLSQMLANGVLAVFVLVPIVPLLAGQINYDNLLILTVPLTLLLAVSVLDGLKQRKIFVAQGLLLAAILLFESLIKYAFLPIALAIVAYMGYFVARMFWRRHGFIKAVASNYRTLSHKAVVGVVVLLVVSAGLCAQRYGVNIVRYHALAPNCAVVLGDQRCQANGPWLRNERYKSQKTEVHANPFAYADQWFHAMVLRSFFAINGPLGGYANDFPFFMPQLTVQVFFWASVILMLVFGRKIFRRRPILQLFLLVVIIYVITLALDNYHGYVETGMPVAVNGRYLLLILPLALALSGAAFVEFFRKIQMDFLKPWLVVVVLLLFLQGGGFVTFILQSDSSWYWQNDSLAASMNTAARTILRPLVWKKVASGFLKYE